MIQLIYQDTDLTSTPKNKDVSVGVEHGSVVLNRSPWWMEAVAGTFELFVIPAWCEAGFTVPADVRSYTLRPYQIRTGPLQDFDVPSLTHGIWADAEAYVEKAYVRPLVSPNVPVAAQAVTEVEDPLGSLLYLSNGIAHRATGALLAAGNLVIWTPAAGKKLRLLSLLCSVSAATVLTFNDGATPILDVTFAGAGTQPVPLAASGILSAAVNNTLNVTSSGAATVYATALGTEE